MVSDVEVDGSDKEGRKRRRALSLEDCRCPVCLEIFLEPVTLPCAHTFCKVCFLESVDKAALCCPLCRRRVSTWARLNSRKNSLVDQKLWDQIQTCFPLQCQRRVTGGEEEEEPRVPVCFPRVSQPGELKQEYEDQVTKLMEDKRFHEEEERKASEDFIQRLLAEEEKLRQEETRRREGDEELARLLSSQLNSAPVSQENVGPPHVTPAKKKKRQQQKEEVGGGQIEKFLFPFPSTNVASSCSFLFNKENIHLQVERPPPKLDSYGQTDGHTVDLPLQVPAEGSCEAGTLEEMTSWVCPSALQEVGAASIGVSVLEAELLCRQRQEEEDRRLALLLQKELDQEEKQRATNRRRGSSDPYLLRHHSSREMMAGSCDTPTRASRKTTKTSSPPSSSMKTKDISSSTKISGLSTSMKGSSSSNSSSKQATLTEMFSFRAANSSHASQ
ncbi:E3 ubiquitin-protein ligase rnf168 isoform 1-T7 [Spinachia spinachia]